MAQLAQALKETIFTVSGSEYEWGREQARTVGGGF